MLTWTEIETRAAAFQKTWRESLGPEKQDDQKFIADFLYVFGVDWRTGLPQHQVFLPNGTPNYIDYLLPGQILIEMKSKGKSLDAAYTQAMAYIQALNPEETPKLLMLSDFDQVRVINLEKKQAYKVFKVADLRKHTRIFRLLAGYGAEDEPKTEIELNTDASYKMARLHDALKENNYAGHPLEVLLVRLLFCLFADDTGIFERGTFRKYITESKPDGSDLGNRLMMLFCILDQSKEQRMTNLSAELDRFRHINGSLFRESLPPATFDAKMRAILMDCCEFDWTQISPAIFGAMFQGVMNPQQRRELGAHYTSEENILKVIKPLFLDELEEEFERSISTVAELRAFHDKLASLTFLDPACGSGNFLIISYHRLRQLEFKILKLLHSNLQHDWLTDHTRVNLHQFYGIEIEDFPCEIAKVSMLLMKHLCDQEVSNYFGTNFIDFPIKDNANIVKGNALRMDWNDVVHAHKLNYIFGNPPFVGYSNQSEEQKDDIRAVFLDSKGIPYKTAGKIDYVAGWFYKAAQLMQNSRLSGAFVATNSVCQGEQVAYIWEPLFSQFVIEIDFAYRTFKWSNEAKAKAAVHCVIVGFSSKASPKTVKTIWNSDGTSLTADNINPYLLPGETVFVTSRSNPICDVTPMVYGSKPTDGGFLMLDEQEKWELIEKEPSISELIRPYMGSWEFLNNIPRYCLWLIDIEPSKYSRIKEVRERIKGVQEFRLESTKEQTRRDASIPTLFQEIRQPKTEYILVPRVSSERREYVPIGFIGPEVICGDQNLMIPNASLYDFGVVTSSTHMAWMRTVAGRLEMRYRYSAQIVYNNFPWPEKTEESVARIEKAAQAVLDARANYPERSYADLYDPLFMPPDLRKAHHALDKEVMRAYGKSWPTEESIVADLMKLYSGSTRN